MFMRFIYWNDLTSFRLVLLMDVSNKDASEQNLYRMLFKYLNREEIGIFK